MRLMEVNPQTFFLIQKYFFCLISILQIFSILLFKQYSKYFGTSYTTKIYQVLWILFIYFISGWFKSAGKWWNTSRVWRSNGSSTTTTFDAIWALSNVTFEEVPSMDCGSKHETSSIHIHCCIGFLATHHCHNCTHCILSALWYVISNNKHIL